MISAIRLLAIVLAVSRITVLAQSNSQWLTGTVVDLTSESHVFEPPKLSEYGRGLTELRQYTILSGDRVIVATENFIVCKVGYHPNGCEQPVNRFQVGDPVLFKAASENRLVGVKSLFVRRPIGAQYRLSVEKDILLSLEIIEAASFNRLDRIRFLLTFRPKIDVTDELRRTPLSEAAHHADAEGIEILHALLDAGASVDYCELSGDEPYRGCSSPLGVAAAFGNTEGVRVLIKAKADVNHRDHLGSTPIILAASAGSPQIVELLLSAGADPNSKSLTGGTPLQFASLMVDVYRRHPEGVAEKLEDYLKTIGALVHAGAK